MQKICYSICDLATFVYPSYTFVNAYFEIHFHKINSYLISDSYCECPFIPKEKEVEKNRKKPFIPPLCLLDLKGKGGYKKHILKKRKVGIKGPMDIN